MHCVSYLLKQTHVSANFVLFYFRKKVVNTSENCQTHLQDTPHVDLLCMDSGVRLTAILLAE